MARIQRFFRREATVHSRIKPRLFSGFLASFSCLETKEIKGQKGTKTGRETNIFSSAKILLALGSNSLPLPSLFGSQPLFGNQENERKKRNYFFICILLILDKNNNNN